MNLEEEKALRYKAQGGFEEVIGSEWVSPENREEKTRDESFRRLRRTCFHQSARRFVVQALAMTRVQKPETQRS